MVEVQALSGIHFTPCHPESVEFSECYLRSPFPQPPDGHITSPTLNNSMLIV